MLTEFLYNIIGITSCSCNVGYSESTTPRGKGKESAFQVTQLASTSDVGNELLSDSLLQWLE